MSKQILITGVTGQDGSYLARFLLNRGDTVHGIRRRTSGHNTRRLEEFLGDDFSKITLHYGEMTDGVGIARLVHDIRLFPYFRTCDRCYSLKLKDQP